MAAGKETVIASARVWLRQPEDKLHEAIQPQEMDCFAVLAMTRRGEEADGATPLTLPQPIGCSLPLLQGDRVFAHYAVWVMGIALL